MPAWHQLVPISGHVEESETAKKLQLYATSIKTSVSTRLIIYSCILIYAYRKKSMVSGGNYIGYGKFDYYISQKHPLDIPRTKFRFEQKVSLLVESPRYIYARKEVVGQISLQNIFDRPNSSFEISLNKSILG